MKVKIEKFEGPLDLLLYLVKKNYLNIYDINLSEIATQYLEYLKAIRQINTEIASEYLVLAAQLIYIKSKELLPKTDEEKREEESLKQEIINRLLEYQRYKEVVEKLREREIEQKRIFVRTFKPKVESSFFEASIFDLISAFKRILEDVPKEVFLEVIKDEYSVEEKISQILNLFLTTPSLKLSELFSAARSKIEIVAIFLAILELIRLKEIIAVQKEIFGEVFLIKRDV